MNASQDTWPAIAQKLRGEGYAATSLPAGVSINLPLFCSVEAMAGASSPSFAAKFGKVGRMEATGFMVAFILFCLFFALYGNGGAFFWVLAPAALLWDGWRWVSTQRAINRIKALYAQSRPA